MKLRVQQEILKLNYIYKVYDDKTLMFTVKANRLILPNIRKISLYDLYEKEIYTVKQEDLPKALLTYFPLLSLFQKSAWPYILYFNGIKKGFFREVLHGKKASPDIEGKIDDVNYFIYAHSGDEYSIFIDDIQEGFINKEHWSAGDGDTYHIEYNQILSAEICAIICTLIDIIHYTSDSSANSFNYEYTWVIRGRKIKTGSLRIDKSKKPTVLKQCTQVRFGSRE
jgi:hypothetical protein